VILLHLLTTLGYTSAGRQISLLSPLLRKDFDVHVAALGPDGPMAELLRAAGVPVHSLGSGRRFDFAAVWALRRLVRDLRPAIIHTWRLPALRAARLLRGRLRSRFHLVAGELRGGQHMNLFDRRLLRSTNAVIASNPAETGAIQRFGVAPELIHELPPVVAQPAAAAPMPELPLPADAKIIMCIGNLNSAHGFHDAIWAADILRYPIPDVHLVIIGDGPERARLAKFARGINPAGGHVHFLPARPDAAALLAHAAVVWVPSRSECARQVLLEAMAAERPVIASKLPGFAALVADGQTGMLVPVGDPISLARLTRSLLDAPELANNLGAAARAAVTAFSPEAVASNYAAMYAALK
jgi:glycosyltransferase involved in cell wall biosynthesis